MPSVEKDKLKIPLFLSNRTVNTARARHSNLLGECRLSGICCAWHEEANLNLVIPEFFVRNIIVLETQIDHGKGRPNSSLRWAKS